MIAPQDDLRIFMLGSWAKPPDHVAWAVLAVGGLLALFALSPAGPRALGSFLEFASIDDLARRRRFLAVAGFVAAFLSLGYVAVYLRGGPRLFEATSYFLQGRAASHGHFAWSVAEPTASFRGRDLLFHAPDRLAGVHPPGYPILLAFGFLCGAPMVMGPLLAAAIAAATYFLARELAGAFDARGRATPETEAIARLAVGFSLVCAALRYHTADTLAHGASALAIATALAAALHARRTADTASFALAGLATGYVVATRPLSAIPIAVAVLVLALGATKRRRAIVAAALAAVPGVATLLVSHAAVGGSVLASPAALYCAASDDPPGCITRGFDAMALLGTASRHLRAHVVDVANFEPLALLLLVPLVRPSTRAVRLALVVVAGLVLVQVPVRSALDLPGRPFADALAVEHAVLAYGASQLFTSLAIARRALVALALACAGFAVHAVFAHQAIASADGGRPKYEPDVVREANVTHGLLFFDTDDGFNLAHTPDMLPSHGLVAVRYRGDDHDRLLYDLYGHPSVHRYVLPQPEASASSSALALPPPASASASATPPPTPSAPFWIPPAPTGGYTDETWRFEAESDWPALAQSGGVAHPQAAAGTCASEGRVLALTPLGAADASATIELPLPKADLSSPRWAILPRVFRGGTNAEGTLEVLGDGDRVLATWTWSDAHAAVPPQGAEPCLDLVPKTIELTAANVNTDRLIAFVRLRVFAKGGAVALDRTHVKRGTPAPP